MRPIWIPVSLLLALALVGAGGQSVAKAAVAFQTPEPLETPLAAMLPAEAMPEVVEQAVRPTPWVLSTPEPVITPPPRKPVTKPRPAAKPLALHTPEPLLAPLAVKPHELRPTVIGLPTPQSAAPKSGAVVYNLVFPVVSAPDKGKDFAVKLTNQPNSNQIEVSMVGADGRAGTPTGSVMTLAHDGSRANARFDLHVVAPGTCEVEFLLDGRTIGRDRDGRDGFTLALDPARVAGGPRRIQAIARGAQGQTLQTVEHTVVF